MPTPCLLRAVTISVLSLTILLPVRLMAAQRALQDVPVVTLAPLDLAALRAEDEQRDRDGLPPRYAIPQPTHITPQTGGAWEDLGPQSRLWRLRIESPGAVSLNLGFSRYHMPPGGQLNVYAADGRAELPPFTSRDNDAHGQLWTPIIASDAIVVEVVVPRGVADQLALTLASINIGYRSFDEFAPDKSGACNVDVACPAADDWRNEAQAVALISVAGSTLCSGYMVNNTAQDKTPYFATANHCGLNTSNAASLVVYWNYQASTCGGPRDGTMSHSQTGAYFRASYATSDFALVELDEDPNPSLNIAFAGWDHSGADALRAACIHHPNADEKAISFENDPTSTTSYLSNFSPGNSSHVRVSDWDTGTTEGGSSGSPLFNQDHHVIGQLHGGSAACDNNLSDWFGRFAASWTGGGTAATRLSDWLDPGNTGATSLDTLPASGANNDNFAGAFWMSGVSGSASGSNATATKESGEPDHAGNAGGASVWWQFIPTASGQATIDTFGSAFDTLFAVYTGSAVDALTPVASNDNSGGAQSRVTFNVTKGVTYHAAVDGFSGATGAITLNWTLPAPSGGSGWNSLTKTYAPVLAGRDPQLRVFRDQYLARLPGGEALVRVFYAALPSLADAVEKDLVIRHAVGLVVEPSALVAARMGE